MHYGGGGAVTDTTSTRVHRPSAGKLAARLVRLSIVTVALGLAAYRLAVADLGPSGLGPLLAALVAVLALFVLTVVLVLARARTVVAPDGIHNRVIGGETHLRWKDLADVRVTTRGVMRTVQVVRTDGRVVRLTALRDAPTMPDPGFDDTIAVIRARITDHRPAGQVPSQADPGS